MIWGAIIIPVIAMLILHYFFHHKTHLIEYCLQFFAPIILIFVCWMTSTSYQIRDLEYWGGWITQAVHEEPWNEYIHRTCSYEVSCGKDCTTTIYYDCSYVDYHDDWYYYYDSNEDKKTIDEEHYLYLKSKFGNESVTGRNRGYTISGNILTSFYDGSRQKIEETTDIRAYSNRVQASHTIMNFPEISKKEAQTLGLYEYPPQYTNMWHTSAVLGGYCPEFDHLNAIYGARSKIHIWVLIFNDKPSYIVQDQINYWKNGNKNELVLCVGLKNGILDWSNVFTWSDSDELRLEIRDKLNSYHGKQINLSEVANWLEPKLQSGWQMKNWHDFDYLVVEPSSGYLWMTYILTIISSIGIAVFIVLNDFHEDTKI